MENRREFLKRGFWMGAAACAAGCVGGRFPTAAAPVGFAAKPLKRVRVGVIGLGCRGGMAMDRLPLIPGVEVTALCELDANLVAKCQDKLTKAGRAKARVFLGPEAYKALCDWDGVDVIYNTTPWQLHVPIALCAMEHGKHVLIEVPAAFTIEDCWALVETQERMGVHCMQLENCCYGETEMLALNLCRLGLLGDLVHGEGAYIHDLREYNYNAPEDDDGNHFFYADYWRLKWNAAHKGNQYETHGLGPICQYMGINRGDRFDYLVSLESRQANFETYAKARFPADDWRARKKVEMGDMNMTMIRTVKGRSILVQHDVSSPRPYNRLNTITGTKGILTDYPFRLSLIEKQTDSAHEFFKPEKAEEYRIRYRHPLWKLAGEIARKVGGHGGMDLLMDLRWAYCLQNGLPLDQDVYDLAAWCSLGELTERSVRSRSLPQDVPDFTRGAWRTRAPLGIETIDPKWVEKIG